MPPKTKEKKKRKKSAKADGPTLEEKYQQTLNKIECLEDHLTMRTEVSRRSQAASITLREKVKEANEFVDEERQNKFEISSDLIRQYKSMQTDLTNRIRTLEKKVSVLQEKLSITEIELAKEKEEKLQIIKEKDTTIAELQYKIEHMESAYENVLHDAFDTMVDRLDKAKLSWNTNASNIQQKNKDILLEFGLNPLDI